MSSISSKENLQRVGFLVAIPSLLNQFGVDPNELLAEVGLAPNALQNPESTVPYRAMGLLLELSAKRTKCPSFGLELGKNIRPATLGVLGEVMRNCETLGSALKFFCAQQHRNAHGGVSYMLESGERTYMGYAVYEPNSAGVSEMGDAATLGMVTAIRELSGSVNLSFDEVLLARSKPATTDPYTEALGPNIRFNAEQTAVAISRKSLDRAIPGADPKKYKALKDKVFESWVAGELDIHTKLRRTLRVGLLNRQTSITEIAAQLGMSVRTLRRRLDDSELGFQEVLDETRLEFIQQLLRLTRLSVSEISSIVGYSDASILSRTFTRWAGLTPTEWRQSRSETAVAVSANA